MRLYVGFLILFPFFIAGCGTPSLLITPVADSRRLSETQMQPGSNAFGPKIALIEVDGMLMNAKGIGLLSPGENKLALFQEELQRAAADSRVKAVVLRINSPGGTVTCSDNMYDMVKEFREQTHKPVVSSAQEVCASGAYYVACGSDAIVANPTSIVGSIGVIFDSFDVSGLMAKIGVQSTAIKSGALKDMGSPFKPLAPDAREVMQGLINEYYARFLNIVRTNRPKLVDQPTTVDGRVFSGDGALKLGLVDKVGRLEDAIDLAEQLAHVEGASVIGYRHAQDPSGSIYARSDVNAPQASAVYNFNLGENDFLLPRGFYYVWQP